MKVKVQRSERHSCNRQFSNSAALNYNPMTVYASQIGLMTKLCTYCGAKFGKINLLLCSNVKVKLLQVSPGPRRECFTCATNESKNFLKNIQNYKSAFQMTFFMLRLFVRENIIMHLKFKGKCITLLDFVVCLIWFPRLKRVLMQLELQKLTQL